jgi:hypothetical protein
MSRKIEKSIDPFTHMCAHTHMGLFRLAIIIIVKIVANKLMVCVAKQDKGTSSTLGS